ncbi:DUF1958 domain-containing protein [Macrococcus animalis]|uniref:DUF1958 domain-containing protein n=1 Tax=Macrococcus animalis TaxID=3395467 RepID=UPI0039BE2FB4
MKIFSSKILLVSFIILIFFSGTVAAATPSEIATQQGMNIAPKYNPKGTIVVSEKNGQILYGDNVDVKSPPASMSKLMTLYLLMEEMDKGKITFDTKVKVNEKYWTIARLPMLSNNIIRRGSTYKVSDLIQLAVTPSSNSATYMLVNLVDKDDSDFVDRMNKKAKELGMKNTRFLNPVGAPNNMLLQYKPKRYQSDGDNLTSARDFAILCQHLVNEHPEILKFTKKAFVTVKPGTKDEESFNTYNHSLEGGKYPFKGTDGLKTGSSDTAGFNVTVTSKQKNMRIIAVILGVQHWLDPDAEFNRNKMANAVMQDAFNQYEYKKVLTKGVHKFNGKEYYIHKDLYDIVKIDQPGKLILKDGNVHYDYERTFASNQYKPATVKYEDYQQYKLKKFWNDHYLSIMTALISSFLLGLGILIYYYWPKIKKN